MTWCFIPTNRLYIILHIFRHLDRTHLLYSSRSIDTRVKVKISTGSEIYSEYKSKRFPSEGHFCVKANRTSRHIIIIQRLLDLKVESVEFVWAVCQHTRKIDDCYVSFPGHRMPEFCVPSMATNWENKKIQAEIRDTNKPFPFSCFYIFSIISSNVWHLSYALIDWNHSCDVGKAACNDAKKLNHQ